MKNVIIIVGMIILLFVMSDISYAQAPKGNKVKDTKTNWIDLDNDGICDTYNKRVRNKKGLEKSPDTENETNGSANQGKSAGKGNFVDADGDGVCDNTGKPFGINRSGNANSGAESGKGAKRHMNRQGKK